MSAVSELAIFDRFSDGKEAISFLGESIYQSGLFGCSSEAQGRVLAMECLARRMPTLRLAETYHLIHGRLSMRADAMLRNFLEAGHTYTILSRTAELASVEAVVRGQKVTFSLSWADAAKEPFVYSGKESEVVAQLAVGKTPRLKDKYATPRSRMQMLWARLVSDMVRACDPRANAGQYTPEEFDADAPMVIEGQAKPAPPLAEAARKVMEQLDNWKPVSEPAPVTTPGGAPPATEQHSGHGSPAAPDRDGYATKLQRIEIERLFGACLVPPEKMRGILTKNYGITGSDLAPITDWLRELPRDKAGVLIGNLQKKLAEKQAADAKVSPVDLFLSQMTAEQRQHVLEQAQQQRAKRDTPLTDGELLAIAQEVATVAKAKTNQQQAQEALAATEEQVNQIKGLLKSVEQLEPGSMGKVLGRLRDNGVNKFAELNMWVANRLIDSLMLMQLESFLASSIVNWKGPAT